MLFESVELAELAWTEKQIQERRRSRAGDIDAWHFMVTSHEGQDFHIVNQLIYANKIASVCSIFL